MDTKTALAYVEKHGVVLMSAHGPVLTLTDAIAGERVHGSWWGHPKAHHIFRVVGEVHDSGQVLVCRLVQGKVTLIHRRLWPALVRLADRLPMDGLAAIREEHTIRGSHRTIATPFPRWVPQSTVKDSRRLSLPEALSQFDPDLLKQITKRPVAQPDKLLPTTSARATRGAKLRRPFVRPRLKRGR